MGVLFLCLLPLSQENTLLLDLFGMKLAYSASFLFLSSIDIAWTHSGTTKMHTCERNFQKISNFYLILIFKRFKTTVFLVIKAWKRRRKENWWKLSPNISSLLLVWLRTAEAQEKNIWWRSFPNHPLCSSVQPCQPLSLAAAAAASCLTCMAHLFVLRQHRWHT